MTIVVAALTLFLPVHCAAQDATTKAVDDFVQAEMKRQRLPGVSLAVVKNGSIVYAKGYGYSNVEHQVPVKPETIFQSGSVGKQFTATAVMMLVEETVNLDEKISNTLAKCRSVAERSVRHPLTLPDSLIIPATSTSTHCLKTNF